MNFYNNKNINILQICKKERYKKMKWLKKNKIFIIIDKLDTGLVFLYSMKGYKHTLNYNIIILLNF